MQWVFLVVVAVGLVAVSTQYARGRWPLQTMAPATHTTPSTGLPGDLAHFSAQEWAEVIDGLRFDTATRGYAVAAVDSRLEEVKSALTDPSGQLSFPREAQIPLQFRGYRTDQVDEVLDQLEALRDPRPVAPSSLQVDRKESASPVVAPSPDDRRRESEPARVFPTWRLLPDSVAAVTYAAIATWLLWGLVKNPRSGFLSQGVQDQQAFEWYFGATAHNLWTLSNPLFTHLQNVPDGVNLMANASVMGLGIPLAPLTWVAGPHVTFLVIEWLGFALTGFAWYWLFWRRATSHRLIAFVGGAFVGFSPAMVSHGNGHPNFLAQFLIPVIIDRLLRLQEEPARWKRHGAILGLLAAWQLSLGEEVLLLAAIGIALVGLVLVVHRQVKVRAMLPGVGLGAATAVLLFGFPLWWQFFGPQSYTELWQPPGGNDLASLWGRATRTIGADPWASAALSMNRTEENAFFGVLLWPVAAAAVLLLWKSALARALAVLIVVTSWLSLGTEVMLHGKPSSIPSLWQVAHGLPLIGNVLPTRFTMVAVPAFAALLVLALERCRTWQRASTSVSRPPSALHTLAAPVALSVAGVATAFALAPMLPTQLVVDPRPVVPEFFSSKAWTHVVHDGSVLAVPPPDIADMRAVDWQAAAKYDFPLVEGYFIGPDNTGTGSGQRGATRRPFSLWLYDINAAARPMTASPEQRTQFLRDLGAWHTDAVVLPQQRENADALRVSLESVIGQPQVVGGVYVWDVRHLRQAGS